jgi:hypothetical protein
MLCIASNDMCDETKALGVRKDADADVGYSWVCDMQMMRQCESDANTRGVVNAIERQRR